MESETLRLFAALPVPADICGDMKALPRQGLDARWSNEKDYHITLRFLGDLPPERLPDIERALEKVQRPIFHIEMQGLGTFGKKRRTVLWADIVSTRRLTALAASINEKLAPLGFDMPNKPYRPHVTLARLNSERNLDAFLDGTAGRIRASWEAHAFNLYRSAAPDETGACYKILRTYPLQP